MIDPLHLRPLLRPLPTPAQSPVYVVKRAFPASDSTGGSPISAFPTVPVPTPVVTSATFTIPQKNQIFSFIPPIPSPLFPVDLRSFSSFGPNAARRLVFKGYGIEDEHSELLSDSNDHSKAYSGRVVKTSPASGPETTRTLLRSPKIANSREPEIDRFMDRVEVAILMVPAPKPNGVIDSVDSTVRVDPRALALLSKSKGWLCMVSHSMLM